MLRLNEIDEVVDLNAKEYYHMRLQTVLKCQWLPANWRERVAALEIVFRDAKGKKLIENVLAGRSSSILLLETMERLALLNYNNGGKDNADKPRPEFGFSIKDRLAAINAKEPIKAA